MTSITLDTYKIVQQLKTKGFSKEQAEGLLDVFETFGFERIVTRGILKSELRDFELRMTIRTGAMIMALGGVLIAIKYFG